MVHFICTTGASIAAGEKVDFSKPDDAHQRIAARLARKRDETAGDRNAFLAAASAETNALMQARCERSDQVTLLLSDTADGKICGDALADLVDAEFGVAPHLAAVAGLQVKDPVTFRREGVANLFEEINTARERGADQDVRLNISGGFKATVPYVALFGMIEGLMVEYIFERAPAVIQLSALPLSFDWSRLADAAYFIERIERDSGIDLVEFDKLRKSYGLAQADWLDAFIERAADGVTLSGFGHVLLGHLQRARAEPRVMLSPIAKRALDGFDREGRPRADRLLAALGDPLKREHLQQAFGNTDLRVAKLGTGARAAWFLHRGETYVCELFDDHDVYTVWWKKAITTRADYDPSEFVAHSVDLSQGDQLEPAPARSDADDEENTIQKLQQQLRVLQQERNNLAHQLRLARLSEQNAWAEARATKDNLAGKPD